MPYYDFRCQDCGKEATIKASIKEKEAGLACPECGSKRLKQLFRNMAFIGGKGQESGPPVSGGGCCPGGGCCGGMH